MSRLEKRLRHSTTEKGAGCAEERLATNTQESESQRRGYQPDAHQKKAEVSGPEAGQHHTVSAGVPQMHSVF